MDCRPGMIRMVSDEIDHLGRGVVEGDPMIGIAVPSEDDCSVCSAQPRRGLDEAVQRASRRTLPLKLSARGDDQSRPVEWAVNGSDAMSSIT
jgi:hypothetical protein